MLNPKEYFLASLLLDCDKYETMGFRRLRVSVIKLLLRPDEVAVQLSISRSKVYELVKEGRLQAWRPNGDKKKPIRITAASLEEFYQSQLIGVSD
jgi:excisionase family DNA binding protein